MIFGILELVFNPSLMHLLTVDHFDSVRPFYEESFCSTCLYTRHAAMNSMLVHEVVLKHFTFQYAVAMAIDGGM